MVGAGWGRDHILHDVPSFQKAWKSEAPKSSTFTCGHPFQHCTPQKVQLFLQTTTFLQL